MPVENVVGFVRVAETGNWIIRSQSLPLALEIGPTKHTCMQV